jgi:dihydrofolate synthase/folylpolyglutamate synthase
MNYQEAESYVLGLTDYERLSGSVLTAANYDLRRVYALLRELGDPHLCAPSVHIAGTKGKGSTASMIAGVLSAAGYRTGLYTSPHLHTVRERFRVDGRMISEEEFASIATAIEPIVRELNRKIEFGMLTTFEVLTAIAFSYFRDVGVDYQVLEAGLGGRLDATNVVKPQVCVITSVSLDHTELLGNTVEKIAEEKAAIIKEGCVAVSGPQTAGVAGVLERVCNEKGVSLVEVGDEVTFCRTAADMRGQSVAVTTRLRVYDLRLTLLGEFQMENAAVAVAALEGLASRGAKIGVEDFGRGFAAVRWPGRMQVLRTKPLVVVDGAHNPYSIGRLVDAIRSDLNYRRCFLVFGASADKDLSGMAIEAARLNCSVFVVAANHPRAAKTGQLLGVFEKAGVQAKDGGTVPGSLDLLIGQVKERDLVCVTGSLFVVAEAIDHLGASPKI